MSGFNHTQVTPYGTAHFWQISDIHVQVIQGQATMAITLYGFASKTDADADTFSPMGQIQLDFDTTQIGTFFASAQSNFIAAVTHEWPDAVFVPN